MSTTSTSWEEEEDFFDAVGVGGGQHEFLLEVVVQSVACSQQIPNSNHSKVTWLTFRHQ